MKKQHKKALANAPAQPLTNTKHTGKTRPSFFHFVLTGENKKFFWAALVLGIVYFIVLRLLFPIPSYYSDSYTYIQAARDNNLISYRPIQYSEIIKFFKGFTTSDAALIFGQYFSNVLANLFLFLTCTYFFPLHKAARVLLFVLLIVNPLYLFTSNYILTDPFFNSLTVAWFSFLIWTIFNARWYYIVIQLLLLVILFKLRYNAITFPLFMAIAIMYSSQALWKKLVSIGVSCLLIILLVTNITRKTEQITGTKTFSAFSGWQLANNAMHVLRTTTLDTTIIEDDEQREIINYMQGYFVNTRSSFDSVPVTAEYMWNKSSPLKSYMRTYQARYQYRTYFITWTAVGPSYADFGKHVIMKHPVKYIEKFAIPNAADYLFPPMEVYNNYNANSDTIAPVAVRYFQYNSNRVGDKHEEVYTFVLKPWKFGFGILNIAFVLLLIAFYLLKKQKITSTLFNKTLICFIAFYLFNLVFVVMLAPTVFRYHLFILTLLFPFIIYLATAIFKRKIAEVVV